MMTNSDIALLLVEAYGIIDGLIRLKAGEPVPIPLLARIDEFRTKFRQLAGEAGGG